MAFLEARHMVQKKFWNTVKQAHLESRLVLIPRKDRVALRRLVAGRRTK
jgi:hypothetical protein